MIEKPIDRVQIIIKEENTNISAFEKATGMSNNSIQTAIKRRSNLKDESLNSILSAFPKYSAEWLLTGNGDKLKYPQGSFSKKTSIKKTDDIDLFLPVVAETADNYERAPKVVTVDSHSQDNIVLVPNKLKAGYLAGYSDSKFISKLPSYRMPGLNNGTFRMFEIEGNSMFPTLAGGYVVGQFVENWVTGIKDNRIYAIISNEIEDGLIKRCINKIKKYNNLICKSDNRRNYPTQNISPESIKEVWEIKLHLNFQLPDPADIYDQLYDLQGEVSSLKDIVKKANLLPNQK